MIQIIYNGFDFNRLSKLRDPIEVRNQFEIKTEFIIVMVNSYTSQKDYETYIDSALEILNNNSNITFLCIGDGDYSKFIKLIPNLLRKNIKLLETQRDIESIMNICDIGVLTPNPDQNGEGISNALM